MMPVILMSCAVGTDARLAAVDRAQVSKNNSTSRCNSYSRSAALVGIDLDNG